MLALTDYLYRLVPANPILLRVVSVGGKRTRDLLVRCGYLGLLILLVVIGLLSGGGLGATDLDTLSRKSASIFELLSYFQLGLVALMAPIFTAGAITQEKDSQTYDILLATPLTNGQIVAGTLLSRLFFVFALLLSGVPVFSITQIFGGVAIGDIVTSFLLSAVTALVCGALAVGIATFKVGTRRTIFSFFMFVAIYLVGGLLLDRVAWLRVPLVTPDGAAAGTSQTSWVTGLNPFLALRTIVDIDGYQPPAVTQLPAPLRFWPVSALLTRPVAFYLVAMTLVSAVVVLPSVVLLRRVAQSTLSLRGWLLSKLRLKPATQGRTPRVVWNNPIAWREAKTKASAAKATVTRYGFIVLGLSAAIFLAILYASETSVPANYIGRGDYNPVRQTLFVNGPDKTFALTNFTQVTYNGEPATTNRLAGRYAVVAFDRQVRGGVEVLDGIALGEINTRLSRPDARAALLGAVFLETCVILLIVTNAAASTVTREKEDGTLDLLLTTPITSRYYIWGKLRGLVSYVLPLVAVPAASVLVFVIYDLSRWALGARADEWTVYPEAAALLPPMLVIVAAFASIVGMFMSLRLKTTVRAVMASLAIVLGAVGALGLCGYTFLDNAGSNPLPFAIASFSPFTVMSVLIAPDRFGGQVFMTGTGDMVRATRGDGRRVHARRHRGLRGRAFGRCTAAWSGTST